MIKLFILSLGINLLISNLSALAGQPAVADGRPTESTFSSVTRAAAVVFLVKVGIDTVAALAAIYPTEAGINAKILAQTLPCPAFNPDENDNQEVCEQTKAQDVIQNLDSQWLSYFQAGSMSYSLLGNGAVAIAALANLPLTTTWGPIALGLNGASAFIYTLVTYLKSTKLNTAASAVEKWNNITSGNFSIDLVKNAIEDDKEVQISSYVMNGVLIIGTAATAAAIGYFMAHSPPHIVSLTDLALLADTQERLAQ